jgi:bacterioferritin-associated ferredoxin
MIVCHCRAVSDRVLREAIQRGHSSVEAVVEYTGAGSCCGGCLASVHEVVDAELNASAQGVKPALRPLRVFTDPRAA